MTVRDLPPALSGQVRHPSSLSWLCCCPTCLQSSSQRLQVRRQQLQSSAKAPLVYLPLSLAQVRPASGPLPVLDIRIAPFEGCRPTLPPPPPSPRSPIDGQDRHQVCLHDFILLRFHSEHTFAAIPLSNARILWRTSTMPTTAQRRGQRVAGYYPQLFKSIGIKPPPTVGCINAA